MHLKNFLLASILFLIPFSACAQPPRLEYPSAERTDHTDEYHGVIVADPFRWMEDLDNKSLHTWIEEEDYLRAEYLKGNEMVDHFKERLTALREYTSESVPMIRGDHLFFYKRAPGHTFGILHHKKAGAGASRALLDVESMNNEKQSAGATSFSQTGAYYTLGKAEGQSRWFEVEIVRVENGEHLPEKLSGFYGGRSNVAWVGEDVGFYYARYEVPGDPQAPLGMPGVYYHRLGTDQSEDALIFEMPEAPELSFTLRTTHDGQYLIFSASESGGTFNGLYERIFYKDLGNDSTPVRELFPGINALFAFESSDGDIFRVRTTHEASNNRVFEVSVQHSEPTAWKTIIPEAEEAIQAVNEIGGRLVVQYIKDARTVIRGFDFSGKQHFEIDQLSPSLSGLADNRESSQAYYSTSILYDPGTIYRLDTSNGRYEPYFRPELNHNPDDFIQEQAFYESKDGTRVPMFILHKKDLKKDGSNPVFMYAYGAWSWAAFPWQSHMIPWMETGGVYVIANIRGGGEYGEAWHEAGIRQNKQNGIDDFIAAAEWLIENNYTSPAKLVANGGSASGIIPGAAMIQRPDLFGASVINFPALDQLRYEQFGSAKGWVSEFGSVDNPDDFKALHAYSPYHNVEAGVCYPATWIQVGEEDETTTPMHGYKFAAALQAAQSCENPVLLKVTWDAGHSYGATPEQRIETQAEELAFLVDWFSPIESGMTER